MKCSYLLLTRNVTYSISENTKKYNQTFFQKKMDNENIFCSLFVKHNIFIIAFVHVDKKKTFLHIYTINM